MVAQNDIHYAKAWFILKQIKESKTLQSNVFWGEFEKQISENYILLA